MAKINKKDLYEDLAYKYKESKAEVEKAVNSQFKFVADKMSKGNSQIRLPYFGVFKPNVKKINRIRQIKLENDKRKNNTKETR